MTPDQTNRDELVKRLDELIGEYWDIGYREGREQRSDGERAWKVLVEIKRAVAALTAQQGADTVAEPVAVTNGMAYAFHSAIADGAIGESEVEEIKTGLRAALANIYAHTAPSTEAVARSEVVVPREPTKDMLEEGFDAINKQYARDPLDDALERTRAVYRAMIAAAPMTAASVTDEGEG